MEIINTVLLLRRNKESSGKRREKKMEKIDNSHRAKAKRFINTLLVNTKGTKTGFCCSLVPCSARWAHSVCVCVTGMLAC